MDKIYGYTSAEPSEMELKNRELARSAAAEGFVLLKNEGNALPLRSKKIALYGMGARMTVKGGLGSGSVEERYSVNIEDGLKNAGYEITTQRWLDDYDREYQETYQAYHDMVEEKIAGLTNPMEIIPLAHSFVYRFPSGRSITQSDIRDSDTDTAVFVLMRQAGEGNDRRLEQGDFYITDIERENLKILTQTYEHTILVINVGGLIDMAFLDEIPGIDAVVLFGQGGEEGGNALADVLSGHENFSGKLTDTIPLHYEDIPFGNEFSYLNGDLENEYYREGIYVGYRYFNSFCKPVRYPFGFGMSYTTFQINVSNVFLDETKVSVTVKVTNTGSCPGREVVQLYLSAPGEGKEYQKLLSFAKTGKLMPGEMQRLFLEFDFREGASFCQESAAWKLDAGRYLVRVGNSSRNTKIAAAVDLDRTVVVRQCKNCCQAEDDLEVFMLENMAREEVPEGIPVLAADSRVFISEIVAYMEPQITETAQEKEILDSLTVEEQALLLQGGDLQNVPKGALDIHGAAGKTATALLEKGIRNVVFSDGPAGLNVVNQVCLTADGTFKPVNIPERYNWGMLAKFAKSRMCSSEGTIVYRYATLWPVELLLAQTWNTELLYQIGQAVGEEMKTFGITIWLAPGMNIHRNPLGGRTFEYYSEDPVLTGELAAALTKGVQSHTGVGTCIKHFCCNNTEDNRNGISSNVSERALREIYLKGFEIAVKKSQPKTVMTSYNQLNHVYTANRYDLLTDILRCEWGFEGLVMTDWGSCNEKAGRPEECASAGNDLIMPGGSFDRKQLLGALAEGRVKPDTVRRSACRVLRMLLEADIPVIV